MTTKTTTFEEKLAKFRAPSAPLTHAQGQVVQCCTYYEGFSLDNHGDELRKFLSRGVDDPAAIVDKHVSDCGLFALAVWNVVGVQDLRLREKYQTGMAISWLVDIAGLHHAVRHIMHDGVPTVGALLHWKSHDKNDDHVSFLTKPINIQKGKWLGECIGGGGADCAIGAAEGNILWSWGRPLHAWYDINALLPGTSYGN